MRSEGSEGRREHKRRETRERIADVAMKLFLKLGYDATTIDAIAEAADVSRRSLFDHFPAKDDILFASQAHFVAAVVDEIRIGPKEEPWPALVEHAMARAIADASTSENIAIDDLVRRTPALQSRRRLKYMHLEEAIAGALMERGDGNKAAQDRAKLLAAIVVAGFRLATSASEESGGPGKVRRSVPREFRDLWHSLRIFADEGLAPRANKGVTTALQNRRLKRRGS